MWSSNYFGSNYMYVGLNFLFNKVQLSFERYGQQFNALTPYSLNCYTDNESLWNLNKLEHFDKGCK